MKALRFTVFTTQQCFRNTIKPIYIFKPTLKSFYNTKQTSNTTTTVNKEDVNQFQQIASEWWDLNGKFKALHKMQPIRMSWIRDQFVNHFGIDKHEVKPLKGMKVLDMACGGGLVSESLARMGADVIGIDASSEGIKIAEIHKQTQPDISDKIKYINASAEEVAPQYKEAFDAITALEIIEHVDNVDMFLNCLSTMLKPGGCLAMSTINRTFFSWVVAILGAEYVLRVVPKGTHQWKKFISPEEIGRRGKKVGLRVSAVSGVRITNPFTLDFKLTKDSSVNYFIFLTKDL